MPEFMNLVGQKFGRLTVVSRAENSKSGGTRWYCKCDCGGESIAPSHYLRTVQRGCKKCTQVGRPTHGLSHLPEFGVWAAMKQRCDNPSCDAYKDYGARGISYCKRWEKFENFYADMGLRPTKDHTLERKNNEGNYKPSNCKWATRIEQARNFRSNVVLEFIGQKKCISEWAEIYGLKHDTIASRLELGWSVEDSITKPVYTGKHWILVNGKMMTYNEADKTLGFSSNTIGARIKRGYTEHEAIAIPIGVTKKQYYQQLFSTPNK